MIKITKNTEPKTWSVIKKTPGITFESADKKDLRKSLLEEQGYICGYCMRRIKASDTRIEHIKPQSQYEDSIFDYNNLIICCNGDITGSDDLDKFHCDRKKGEVEISFSPFNQDFISTLSYSSKDGKIKSSVAKFDEEIDKVLNLNLPILKSNRLAVLQGILNQLSKKKDWKTSDITSILDIWSKKESNKYKPYCGIVIWFLSKHLRKK